MTTTKRATWVPTGECGCINCFLGDDNAIVAQFVGGQMDVEVETKPPADAVWVVLSQDAATALVEAVDNALDGQTHGPDCAPSSCYEARCEREYFKDPEAFAKRVGRIQAEIGPVVARQSRAYGHLPVIMALLEMASHHGVHDSAKFADVKRLLKLAWAASAKKHEGCRQ